MESLTSFIQKRKKVRKQIQQEKKNGPVIIIAQSIDKEPKPIRRKVLQLPHHNLNISHYTPIEVPYLDKNGNDKIYVEPSFEDLPRNIQMRERRRSKGMCKISDIETIYRLYGK